MFRRAPADRLLRRGRGQTGEAAKGRRLWCRGHRDRRPSFFFRGLAGKGGGAGKSALEEKGVDAGSGWRRCPSGHGPLRRGGGWDGSGWRRCPSGHGPSGRGRRPGREWRRRCSFGHGLPGRGDGRVGSSVGAALLDTDCLGGETAGMGADGGAVLPDTARLGGERRLG
ncbi:hypothetical protein HMPREF0262_02966 [Clostridium sp. ATCC 29733]|nr:hypothetical protein HMPREF0262_02966 [Clostridium sp. ATCC 29733]